MQLDFMAGEQRIRRTQYQLMLTRQGPETVGK